MPDQSISLIISSFNQSKRLKFSIESAIKQKYSGEFEIIIADDNSSDDTKKYLETIKNDNIKITYNPFSIKGIYTLADNWNYAAQIARNDRLIFSNGDIIFLPGFIQAHGDPLMRDKIIFGPANQTTEKINEYLNISNNINDLISNINKYDKLNSDLHDDGSAETYNKEFTPWHPWGYNFSIPKKAFHAIGGFPSLRVYGQEELYLCLKANYILNMKIVSNCNARGVHLWHTRYNDLNKKVRDDYSL